MVDPPVIAPKDRPGTGLARIIAVVVAGLGFTWLMVGLFALPQGQGWAYDLEAYLNAAARLVDTGSLYQSETLSGPFQPGPFGLYMYSPTLGVGLLPIAGMAVVESALLWYGLHVLALVTACALMPVSRTIRLLAFGVAALSFGVLRDALLGNVSVLLLLPTTLAWRWLDQPLGSMAQAVAMSVRPMLGILLIWQLLRRQWRAVAWTIGSGVVLILLTLPFVGSSGYHDYLTVLRNVSDAIGVHNNHDLGSTALALGFERGAATAALLAGYAIAIGAMLLSLRRDRELGFVVTATASLLLSPLLWDHYLALLVLPAAFLASRGRWWGLGLPLLSWLPDPALPFVVIAAVWLPFLTREPPGGDLPAAGTVAPAPRPVHP